MGLLIASAYAATDDKLHFFDFDNAKMLYKGDWSAYKKSRPHDNDCSIAESDNWKGAQQCAESWECRGARMCERGGWCSGFDGVRDLHFQLKLQDSQTPTELSRDER